MARHLQDERSAYLRQHAQDPVDWYPWGEAAFEKARREGKPMLLSIGYAGCHWCHVMAEESFRDAAVAQVLNERFVAVKVDREERPDVDAVYMEACTAMNGSGGWPLTILMTPTGEPFFAGTYLPRDSRGRQIGLLPLLKSVAERWARDRNGLEKTAGELTAYLRRERPISPGAPDPELPRRAFEQLRDSWDEEYGGFGTAPKFPMPQALLFLLQYAARSGEKEARRIAEQTLKQMARGGIFDQIGGGFARYSTDREWLVPHFEKTLYDNALLSLCYCEAWQEGHYALYRRICEETLDYCLRELRSPLGGFYSGQGADSQGGEGAFYLYTPEDVKAVLGEDEGRHFCENFDITSEGNFRGKSIPNLLLEQRWELLPEGYTAYRARLREARAQRPGPETDRKLPTAWNGMLLMALARAARLFSSETYAQAARALGRFLLETAGAGDPEGLQAVCYEGEGADAPDRPGQLDDYAFAALGLLELYGLDYDSTLLVRAEGLAEQILAQFTAPDGGAYRTSARGEALLKRPREIYDAALPSGNSASLLLFQRLARLSGRARWREAAQKAADFLSAASGDWPAGAPFGLLGLMDQLSPGKELLCVAQEPPALLEKLTARYDPSLCVLLKRPGDAQLAAFAPYTADCAQKDGKPTFYVCQGGACGLPFTE